MKEIVLILALLRKELAAAERVVEAAQAFKWHESTASESLLAAFRAFDALKTTGGSAGTGEGNHPGAAPSGSVVRQPAQPPVSPFRDRSVGLSPSDVSAIVRADLARIARVTAERVSGRSAKPCRSRGKDGRDEHAADSPLRHRYGLDLITNSGGSGSAGAATREDAGSALSSSDVAIPAQLEPARDSLTRADLARIAIAAECWLGSSLHRWAMRALAMAAKEDERDG